MWNTVSPCGEEVQTISNADVLEKDVLVLISFNFPIVLLAQPKKAVNAARKKRLPKTNELIIQTQPGLAVTKSKNDKNKVTMAQTLNRS